MMASRERTPIMVHPSRTSPSRFSAGRSRFAAIVATAAALLLVSACVSEPAPPPDVGAPADVAPAGDGPVVGVTGSDTVAAGSISPARRGELPARAIGGTDTSNGERVEGHLPPATPGVVAWSDWCFFDGPRTAYTGAYQCSASMSSFAWALTHLGADEVCVLDQYAKLIEGLGEIRGNDADGSKSNAVEDAYGWHNCATVVDPDPGDGRSLAEKCEALPGVRDSWAALYGGCAEWAELSLSYSPGTPNCSASTALLIAWLKAHHGDASTRGARFDC